MRLPTPRRQEGTLGVLGNGSFHRCIELINAGETSRAKVMLTLDVICKDSDNVAAWALMAHLADDREQEIRCLEQVLRLRPADPYAKMCLLDLRNGSANGGKSLRAMTRPLRYSRREILWERDDALHPCRELPGRGFGTSKDFLGWGIIPDLQEAWPTGLKFRSMMTPFAEKVESPRNPRKLANTLRGAINTLLVMVIIGALVMLVVPGLMGANLLMVVSQSMEPTVPMGSIVVSYPMTVPDEIGVGDVITYSVADLGGEAILITHRVVDVIRKDAEVRYRTQGDGVNEPDTVLVSPDKIIGKMWFSLPLVGYLVAFIRTPIGYLTLIGLPALLFIVHEWWEILRPKRERDSLQLTATTLSAGSGGD